MVPVKLMPGTLNVGHALPTIAQAFIYTQLVPVDSATLLLMIAAACLGSWVGAGLVVHWPRRTIQIGMGLALLGAARLMLMTQLNLFPGGGDTLDLAGVRLAVGLAGNFVLGVLMMLGIGLYAPCMILVSLLGMNPTAAFPIMMGSCAFLMPIEQRQLRAHADLLSRRRRLASHSAGFRLSCSPLAGQVASARRSPLARRHRRGLYGGEHADDRARADMPAPNGGPPS